MKSEGKCANVRKVHVKKTVRNFSKVCKKLCDENKGILETLSNIEPKNNES